MHSLLEIECLHVLKFADKTKNGMYTQNDEGNCTKLALIYTVTGYFINLPIRTLH